MGSGHSDFTLLAYDLYCSEGTTLRRDPTSALPVLKCLVFLEQEVPHFCFVSHTFIFHWLLQIGQLVLDSQWNANEEEKIPTILLFPSWSNS